MMKLPEVENDAWTGKMAPPFYTPNSAGGEGGGTHFTA